MTYPDSTRPTEADVAELVRVAQRAVPILEAGRSNVTATDLAHALKPFQPDLEDELIEAIAITLQQEASTGRAAYHDMARAALQVLKDRDLLKTRKEVAL